MTKRCVWIVILALLVLPLVAQADEIRGRRHIYVWATDPVETVDSVATVVPEMTTSFELNRVRSILATFCAETEVYGTLLASVRIDGVLMLPGENSLDEEFNPDPGTELRSHCFSFALPNRAVGPHSVEVQWRKIGTAPGTGYARMLHRSLVLEIL